MSFFGVNVTNPFSTPVGQRIEQATDAGLPSENWALNMEICDIINETEDGPRDAIKAIKRRLNQAAGKNYTIVMYTLTVLETCVKNCGKRFHALSCSREFVMELVKLIGPKNEPPTAVQEKVLNLIQCWADTFRNQPHTQGVVQVYQELKAKGIEFPMTDLDAMAPIITPERSVPEQDLAGAAAAAAAAGGAVAGALPNPAAAAVAAAAAATAAGSSSTGASQRQVRPDSGGQCRINPQQPIALNEQQMVKLRSELDVVHGNMRVLSEMLAALSSGLQDKSSERAVAEDMELLTELHNTCKAMQERVVDLIGKLAHDELTAELLQINDEMNNLFLRYSRFTKNKTVPASALVAQAIGATGGSGSGTGQQLTAAQKKKLEAGDSLIDLSDDEAEAAGAVALPISSIDKRMGDLALGGDIRDDEKSRRKANEKDEFDAFAQSRTASFDASKNRQELRGSDEEDASSTRAKNAMQSDKTLTSSEFERFLAERTAAVASEVSGGAAAAPIIGSGATVAATAAATGAVAAGSSSSSTVPTIQRQIDKDQEDKSLFAL